MDIISNDEDDAEKLIINELNSNKDNSDFKNQDNIHIEKGFLKNFNLGHRNLLKVIEFGINRNTCGPYEFGVRFNARYFMNIIREYFLRLNCIRLNFIFSNKMIYFYGHYEQTFRVYTKINTTYISADLVDILEGHSKEFRANFDVLTLLHHLELHNFSKKESIKLYFAFNENDLSLRKIGEENQNSYNPFDEIQGDKFKFDQEFNFEQKAIPGNIIIETQKFKCNIECNFAPPELNLAPRIPSSIFSDYILSIGVDKLNLSTFKSNFPEPLDIYCNHYICNFVYDKKTTEDFFTYDKSEDIEFKKDNAIKFCNKIAPEIDESNLFLKMIYFKLNKPELDALKIINKKTSVIHFYAGNNKKYYFTKETDEQGNISSAIILYSEEDKPLINNIENCCFYSENWEVWINYLKNHLPKDCINQLEKVRTQSILNDDNLNASTNNKRKKNMKQQKKSSVKSANSKISNNKNSDANKENDFDGLYIFSSDKDGSFKKISYKEIKDIGHEPINKENKIIDNEKEVNNPFFQC